jgi:putative SOS response-associated peptidase YedK
LGALERPAIRNEILSCSILTCGPDIVMGNLHDRMPVILSEAEWPKWQGEAAAADDELLAMLKPCPDESLKIWAVDKMVGNVRNPWRRRRGCNNARQLWR